MKKMSVTSGSTYGDYLNSQRTKGMYRQLAKPAKLSTAKLSPSQASTIRAKANRIIGK